jgi:hypothetical protein
MKTTVFSSLLALSGFFAGCQGALEGPSSTSFADAGTLDPSGTVIDRSDPSFKPDAAVLEPPRVYSAGAKIRGTVVEFDFVVPDGMRLTTVSGQPGRYEIFNRDTDRHDGFVFMNVGYLPVGDADLVNPNGAGYNQQEVNEATGTYWSAAFQRRAGLETVIVRLDDRPAFDQLVASCSWVGRPY